MLRRARAGADHDELFLRARHGDVQHAQLLGLGLAAQLTLKCEPRDRGVFDRAFRVHADRPEAVFRVDEHGALEVHAAERAREVRKDHDRKFQSLGLVDAHDRHTPGIAGGGGHCALVLQAGQVLQKLGQIPLISLFKPGSQLEEGLQVGPAQISVLHRSINAVQACKLQAALQKLAQGAISGLPAKLGQDVQKLPCLG